MCPACVSALALITIGATSAGGLAVYATMKFTDHKIQEPSDKTEGDDHE